MASPGEASVRGAFDGAVLPLRDGEGRAVRTADGGFAFELPQPGAAQPRRWPVDGVLASGRTHQLYLTRGEGRRYRLLPAYWASLPGAWASLDPYRPSSLDPQSPGWWGRGSLIRYSCLDCHASGAWYERTGDGSIETRWIDLAIDCEECHADAAAHARGEGPTPRSLKDLSPQHEAQLCGRCHGYKVPFDLGRDRRGLPVHAFRTPAYEGFRPDGTQRQTVYQLAGHLLSECYGAGGLTCGSCHDPHSGRGRDLAGRPASGEQADRQCTVCHRDLADEASAAAHVPHPGDAATCADCHMGWSWILDSPATHQRTSDHSISIPRPEEAARFGTSLACLHCHDGRDTAWASATLAGWGAARAEGVRPWVETLALGKRSAPEALPRLLAVLDDPESGAFMLQASLALLEAQPPSSEARDRLTRWADHPSPILRAYALRALMRHDPDRASEWRRRGTSDPGVFVRLAAFGGEHDLKSLSPDELSRAADDTAMHALGPSEVVSVYATVAKAHLRRGELEAAKAYLRAARSWAAPEQVEFHALDSLDWLADGAAP